MDTYRRASSDSSGLTRNDSPGFVSQDVLGIDSASAEWTDEKHSLYLKSMETSFVNQLYSSMDLLGWYSPQDMPNPEAIQHQDVCAPSGKFKVLRDGCWENINFHNSGPQPSMSIESQVHLKSPWIQHFRSLRKSGVVPSPDAHQVSSLPAVAYGKFSPKIGAASCSKHPHSSQSNLRHHHHHHRHQLVDDNAEVSDQNFVDEDNEKENATNCCSSKRMKTTPEASSNDQVVPHGKLPPTAE